MFQALRGQVKICLSVWLFAVLTLLAQAVQAKDITVATSADLNAALTEVRRAKSGSWTIHLQPAIYSDVLIKDVTKPLNLVAADPQNRPRLTKLTVADSANVTLSQVVIDYVFPGGDEPLWSPPFRLYHSRNIAFDQVLFDGDIFRGNSPADNGYPMGQALVAQDIKGLAIRNSEIRKFWLGVSIVRSNDIVFTGNNIHSLRKDGMNLAQVRRVLIENNIFHDFDRSPKADDHADFIQLFSTNTDSPSVGVTIRNNIFNSGHGLWTQSIFFRNDRVDTGQDGPEMFFRDILIENNVIINSHLHGITIGETNGLTIRHNTLIRNRRSGEKSFSEQLASPSINVAPRSRHVRITDNIAYRFPTPQDSSWVLKNNLEIQDEGRVRPGFYDLVFENARNGDPRNLASFRYRKGGPAAVLGVGAPQLEPNE